MVTPQTDPSFRKEEGTQDRAGAKVVIVYTRTQWLILACRPLLRVLRQLMTPDVTYVSSSFDNPKLKKVCPGLALTKGPQTLSEVFAAIQRFWKTLDFKVTDTIRMPWRAGCSSIWGVRYARGMWFNAREGNESTVIQREQHQSLYLSYLDYCNEHDFDGMASFIHRSSNQRRPYGSSRGCGAIRALLFSTFPDWHWEIQNLVVDSHYIAGHFAVTGTHRGAFQGIEATGRRVTISEFTFYRLEGGKSAEVWDLAARCETCYPHRSLSN